MTHEEALEIVVAKTKHERFRALCDESHRDHAYWRQKVVLMACKERGIAPPPPLALLGSAARAAARYVASGLANVDRAEFDRRHSLCESCEMFDASHDRCRKCGCHLAIKPWMKSEHCPLEKW